MDEKDIKLKLLLNVPISIEGIGHFKLPSVKTIVDIGEDNYHEYLSSLLFSKDILMKDDQVSEELQQYTDYQVLMNLMIHDYYFKEIFLSAMELLLNKRPIFHDNGIIYMNEPTEETILTEDKWNVLKRLVKIGNYITDKEKEEEIEAGNERARKFMEKLKKKKEKLAKMKKKQDDAMDLHSIVSAVSWRTKGIDVVGDLTIYQLYDALYRLNIIDNYHYTFTGIYTGNIDTKGMKMSDINWANVIK